jgi:hypothetical protein
VTGMKAYGGIEIEHHIFLTLALDGGEWAVKSPRYPLHRRIIVYLFS